MKWGQFNWLSNQSRPDISYDVLELSMSVKNATVAQIKTILGLKALLTITVFLSNAFFCFNLKSVQSTLSHLQSPPEQIQSQHNYDSVFSKSHLYGMILFTMLVQNRPKSKKQCFF